MSAGVAAMEVRTTPVYFLGLERPVACAGEL